MLAACYAGILESRKMQDLSNLHYLERLGLVLRFLRRAQVGRPVDDLLRLPLARSLLLGVFFLGLESAQRYGGAAGRSMSE